MTHVSPFSLKTNHVVLISKHSDLTPCDVVICRFLCEEVQELFSKSDEIKIKYYNYFKVHLILRK